MKILIAMLMMTSFAFAGTQEVSQKIATSYQKLMMGAKNGTYTVTLQALYNYEINGEGYTLPVFLMTPQPVSVPSTMKGCEEAGSIPCAIAEYLNTWFQRVRPEGQGEFHLELAFYGKGILRESTVVIKNSELE